MCFYSRRRRRAFLLAHQRDRRLGEIDDSEEIGLDHKALRRGNPIPLLPVSRTIGQGRLVDEMVARFTRTIPMDWMLPGIPPTRDDVEVARYAIIALRNSDFD
jgi:hypothetical protein